MNSFQYFIATLPTTNCEKITLFSSPEELNVNISTSDSSSQFKWDNVLDTIESQFWLTEIYEYLCNDKFWGGSCNISYSSNNIENNIIYLAYKELLMPISAAPYSSYYLTLDNKSRIKNHEPFPSGLKDYEPLKLFKKLNDSLPNKLQNINKSKI